MERLIAVDTPLGEDRLLLRSFTGAEGISKLFHFQLDMLSEDFNISFDDIIGQKVTVSVKLADGVSERYFNGHVSRFSQLPGEDRLARYQADVVPWMWFLTRTADCRIFQNKTVPDIVQQVFRDFGFQDFEVRLTATHDPWDYCVQYRETACDFILRLLEQEGIFFFFRHEDGKHILVLADSSSAHQPCTFASKIRYEHVAGSGYDREDDVVLHWRYQQEFRPGKYALRDYNFETPSTSLLSSVKSTINQGGNQNYEIFDYPGEYEKKNQGDVQSKLRIEEQELPHEVVHGDGNCRTFSSGFRFELTEHERKDQNTQYVLTDVAHSASSGHFHSRKSDADAAYSNSFTCTPLTVPFRPARVTARHLVQGPQTAVVVGPAGEEIYTDKYGRVKVQFHWDRAGKHDEKSSCWIRVSQPWAGKSWGAIWIPRIGQEVVVDFLEGDPDRPLITGRVYNAEQMPPYELPANQTQSGFKSRSSKGGASANSNEIRFEDRKGDEEIFIHAEKDFNTVVEHDESITVNEGNRQADVSKGNETITVAQGDRNVNVPIGTYTLKAKKIVFEATEEFSLKCSLGTMKINPGGIVSLNSPLVKVNS
jgi:type VI secretion system secreted protein VgrG